MLIKLIVFLCLALLVFAAAMHGQFSSKWLNFVALAFVVFFYTAESFPSFIFVRRKPLLNEQSEDELLNYVLDLARLSLPIQSRLGKDYPQFTAAELDKYNLIAMEAIKYSYDLHYALDHSSSRDGLKLRWRKAYLARYPWIDKKNLRHMYNAGKYTGGRESA